MTTVMAVYEHGVLRPTEPLTLTEGQEVQLTIFPRQPRQALRPPTPEEQDYIDRLKAAKTVQEAIAVMNSAPPPPGDGYDLCKALNENRRATGERLLFPGLEEGAGQ